MANAGLPGTGRLGEYSSEQIDRVIDVNLRSPIHMTHALLPGMLERGRGHLVYISSISGKVATAYASLYNATKFGLRGFSFAMHEDLRGTGVGATAVFPGAVADAGMWADGGLDLPPGVKPSKPSAVADAVIEGIEKDKPEINVGNPIERLGGVLAGPAPRLVSFINRHGPDEQARRGARRTPDREALGLDDRLAADDVEGDLDDPALLSAVRGRVALAGARPELAPDVGVLHALRQDRARAGGA